MQAVTRVCAPAEWAQRRYRAKIGSARGCRGRATGCHYYVVFFTVVIMIQSLFTDASPVTRSSRATEMHSNLSLPRLLCLCEKKFNQEETRLRKNTASPPLRTCNGRSSSMSAPAASTAVNVALVLLECMLVHCYWLNAWAGACRTGGFM